MEFSEVSFFVELSCGDKSNNRNVLKDGGGANYITVFNHMVIECKLEKVL